MEFKSLSGSKIEFAVNVPAADFEKYIQKAIIDLGKNVKRDGFRPGKVPKEMIISAVGWDKVLATAADSAVKKSYADKVVENKLKVIGAPEITVTKIAQGNDFEYKVVTAVMPNLAMGEYAGEVKKINREYAQKESDITVTSEEVDKEIEKLRKGRSQTRAVERKAQKGDRAIINFQILVDNVPIEGGTHKDYPLVIGSNAFIPGFEDALVGMKKREKKEFKVRFPQKYHDKNLANREAQVHAEMKEVEEITLPDINDKFARSLGKFENLEALKKSMRDGMQAEKERAVKDKRRDRILDVLCNKTQIELPNVLVKGELEKMIADLEQRVAAMGISLDDYLGKAGKKIEDLEKEWEPGARKRVTSTLALHKLAHERELHVSSDEIEKEMNKVLQYYRSINKAKEDVDLKQLYGYTKNMLENEKVLQYLESL